MKKIFILSTIFFHILISYNGYSQISLAKGFKCADMSIETNMRDNYFSDGTFRFQSEAWGREVEAAGDILTLIRNNYENKIVFRKTKDGLYWGTGAFNGEFKYVIIIPNQVTTVMVSSPKKGIEFSNYSAWLLQQIRNNIRSSKDFYFTDYKGKSCY